MSAFRKRTTSRSRACEKVELELEMGPARDREGERARNAVEGTGGQSRGGAWDGGCVYTLVQGTLHIGAVSRTRVAGSKNKNED